MIRILIIISVTGLLLSAVCLSAAMALGGRELLTKGWDFSDWAIRIDEETDDVSITPAGDGQGGVFINGQRVDDNGDGIYNWGGDVETRDFEWSGAGEIDIGMPADVTYTQGPTPKLTVTGPAEALNRFYVERGKLRLRGWSASNTFSGIPTDNDFRGPRPPRLKIAIVAPGVTRFDVSGSETLTIDAYNQDSLDLDVSGAGKVTAKGSARIAILDLSGAADVDLGGMSLNEADAEMSGASKAVMGPRGQLEADISGSSRLTLTQQPSRMQPDVSGAAVIEYTQGYTAPSAPATSEPPAAKAAAAPAATSAKSK